MEPDFIFKYFWVAAIAVTFINAIIYKKKAKKHIEEKPELEEGYHKFIKGFLFYGNIPWVIMGIGIISGMVNNMFEYFNPNDLNPIVLVFHASIIFLWLLSIRWIYFKKGAEFLENHPGLVEMRGWGKPKQVTAKQIKMFLPLPLLGGIAGEVAMWMVEVPAFPF